MSYSTKRLGDVVEILDSKRVPINSKERQVRKAKAKVLYPYYGATGQVDEIDNYLLDGEFVLLGEDGAPFLDPYKSKAYLVQGKIWVNNHAHILLARNNKYVKYALNYVDYQSYVTGTTRLKLNQSALKRIIIPFPDENEQKRIVAKIEELFSEIDNAESAITTASGYYKQELVNLTDDIRELGMLVRMNIIHRTTLAAGNVGTNADLRFGDMTKMPWWRQPDDDILPTATAMLTELHRLDDRGLVADRAIENKIIVTCRFVSILMASILKSKGIPARVRSGNAPYFEKGQSDDHWINQYWDDKRGQWVMIDVDGSLSLNEDFDPYDMTEDKFDFPAKAWLDVRSGKVESDYFYNAGGFRGAMVVAWSLFYDFHSLMNDENIYLHLPQLGREAISHPCNNFDTWFQHSNAILFL
ncbi:restriction modification system DNA specificity domain [candidate division TM7 genomosp. GTL1]|nr:restriction modification system DNA specificity domain [candidate division TM7 genomosp. GTL1]